MIDHWREKLGVEVGMTKEEALERFRSWREKMKTCQRCEGEKYVDYCPIRLVCQESELEEEVTADESGGEVNPGSRVIEEFRLEEVGIG